MYSRKSIAFAVILLFALVLVIGWYQFSRGPLSEPGLVDASFSGLVQGIPRTINVSVNAIDGNGRILVEYTCDGDNIMPLVTVSEFPNRTRALALIVYDPDAPRGTFIHWLVVLNNVHGWIYTLYSEDMIEGVNSYGHIHYDGPCPPPGDKPHRYIFLVLALDENLELEKGFTLDELLSTVKGHVIAYGYETGTYQR